MKRSKTTPFERVRRYTSVALAVVLLSTSGWAQGRQRKSESSDTRERVQRTESREKSASTRERSRSDAKDKAVRVNPGSNQERRNAAERTRATEPARNDAPARARVERQETRERTRATEPARNDAQARARVEADRRPSGSSTGARTEEPSQDRTAARRAQERTDGDRSAARRSDGARDSRTVREDAPRERSRSTVGETRNRDDARAPRTNDRVRERIDRSSRPSGEPYRTGTVRVGRTVAPVVRDRTAHRPAPQVHRRYRHDARQFERRWAERYRPQYDRRKVSVHWHFWYGPRVYRYEPYRYYPRRFYRLGRPVIGFYIRIPSFNRWSAGWSSTYVYKQVVRTEAGFSDQRSDNRIEVHTRIRQTVKRVYRDRVRLEFRIQGISLYDDGYFLGDVLRVPNDLGTMNVTLYNDGYVEYDRMSYLVGNPSSGFELISTRYYGGHLLNEFRRADGLRVGELDLYDRRVRRVNDSYLFTPHDFNGLVPIPLLPDDDYWGFQYLAGGHLRSDNYFYGGVDYYDEFDAYDDTGFYTHQTRYFGSSTVAGGSVILPSFSAGGGADGAVDTGTVRSFGNEGRFEYQIEGGAPVSVERTVEIARVGG